MTIRILCATSRCDLQAAQAGHDAQTIATLRAQVAQVTAERDDLARRLASTQVVAQGAIEGKEFYYEQYKQLTKEAQWPDKRSATK